MKKIYLYMTAVTALTLTACSQDDSVFADSQSPSEANAVVFDTYLSNNSTRAGLEGVMSTTTLQQTGFGIVAMQGTLATELKGGEATLIPTIAPNFMWNQYVGYEASNWVYSPLKYWPNETTDDKATGTATEMKGTPDNEGVSFYAYAPFVEEKSGTETIGTKDYQMLEEDADAVGIISLTKNSVEGDPKVHYKVAVGATAKKLPSNSVDLLWGVSSGFTYHPVNQFDKDGSTPTEVITMDAGLPVEQMQKPGLEEKIKFDFKHALARIGMTVVGAFDQKAQGGTLDDATRVTIDEITVTSDAFAIEGVLNLDNTAANRALWELAADTKYNVDLDGVTGNDAGQIKVTKATDDEMNPELRFADAELFPKVAGVKATEQYVLTENTYTLMASKPEFDWKKTYFSDENGTLIALTSTNIEWTKQGDYEWVTYDATAKAYTTASEPTWSLYDSNDKTTLKAANVTSDPGTGVDVYVKSGSTVYTLVADKSKVTDWTETNKYYTIDVKSPVAKYKNDVYELTTKPLYFMVIPTTGNNPSDQEVTVAIKYHVTTADALMHAETGKDNVVDTENYIKQVVTLKEFTNGKAYNLKLILGLTSVKVDAEVSNWEVGTVESNLPQNLE